MKPALAFLTTLLLGSLAIPGFAAAQDPSTQEASHGSASAIVPLDGPVLAGQPDDFHVGGENASDANPGLC